MEYMFYGSYAVKQDIGIWNTGSVTDMQYTFFGPYAFNYNIGIWNIGSVTDMEYIGGSY